MTPSAKETTQFMKVRYFYCLYFRQRIEVRTKVGVGTKKYLKQLSR